ncbi:YoaK family protein [Agreia sp. Leaf244]|uniref:YoaK family protein n=1 Tax=Agreia sp. Leaf244 TaxID=1736305 RepID=UPI000A9F16C7|nr:YoaK family protein [Agreia sp. Leaf244]
MLRRLRSKPANLHLGLMLALTFSTGIADAVGYLGLDKVFTANMTGNVVILGMAIAGADDLPVIGPLVALFAFMLGAAIGGRVLRPVKVGWTTRTTVLFSIVGAVMVGLAIALFVNDGPPPAPYEYIFTGSFALVMGVQAATARHIAVKDVTTVVVTSTITGLAADSRLAGGSGQPWFRRAGAILLIGGGAAVGALLMTVHIGWGVALAAFITLVVALTGHLTGRPHHAPVEPSEVEASA